MDTTTPNLSEASATAAPAGGAPAAAPNHNRPEIWLRRLMLVVEVVFFVEVGMLLVVLPWSEIWSRNVFVAQHFQLRSIMDMGFVKGMLTGLGFVNIWIGIWDAVHYREDGK